MADVSPYLVPAPGRVGFGPWRFDDEGVTGELLPDELDGWDPATDIALVRSVELDLAGIRSDTRIPDEVELRLTTSWASSTSGMAGTAGSAADLCDGLLQLRGSLPGLYVGGTVTLRTTLVVGRSWDAPPGTASEAGSILAVDEYRLALEGRATQFPIEVVDFATTRLHPEASWHLTLQPEMEKPFLGACWLSLNARDSELIEAISAKKPTPRQDAVLSQMNHGVAQMLIEAAEMAEEAFDLTASEWPPESVGDVLSRYVRGAVEGSAHGSVTLENLTERQTQRAGRARLMGFGRSFR